MRLSLLQLNRALLARQLLLHRERASVVEAVHRVVALQAQEPASPYLALWNRLDGFDPADLDRAFETFAIVKGTSLRITLHAVTARDHPAFHEAMQPSLRASRLMDRRFRTAGLDPGQADAVIPAALAFADRPRTNAEMEAWLDRKLGALPWPGLWWAIRTYGPFIHAPTGGPWSFGPRPSYLAAPELARHGDPERVLPDLVLRYLEGFGPATLADVARFALVERARVRTALATLGDRLVRHEGPDGDALLDVPGAPLPPEQEPAPARLLPMWDNVLLAHADRRRVLPDAIRPHVIRRNGDTLPAVLADGFVAGVWRPVPDGIEVTALRPLDARAWRELDPEARALAALLGNRDPGLYARFGHWWRTLPAVEVRVLGS